MMKIIFNKKIYYGENAKADLHRIRSSLKKRRVYPGLYIICLSSNPNEQLDIIRSEFFWITTRRSNDPDIIALAVGRNELKDVLEKMSADVYNTYKSDGFRAFFKEDI